MTSPDPSVGHRWLHSPHYAQFGDTYGTRYLALSDCWCHGKVGVDMDPREVVDRRPEGVGLQRVIGDNPMGDSGTMGRLDSPPGYIREVDQGNRKADENLALMMVGCKVMGIEPPTRDHNAGQLLL